MTMTLLLLWLLHCTCFCGPAWAAQTPLGAGDRSLFHDDFDELAARLLSEWHTPGVAVAIVEGNMTSARVREIFSDGRHVQ